MCQASAIDINYMSKCKKMLKGKNEEQSIIGVNVNDSAYFHLLPVSFNLT